MTTCTFLTLTLTLTLTLLCIWVIKELYRIVCAAIIPYWLTLLPHVLSFLVSGSSRSCTVSYVQLSYLIDSPYYHTFFLSLYLGHKGAVPYRMCSYYVGGHLRHAFHRLLTLLLPLLIIHHHYTSRPNTHSHTPSHSLTHSLSPPYTHALAHSPTHYLTHSLICLSQVVLVPSSFTQACPKPRLPWRLPQKQPSSPRCSLG